MHKSTVSQAVFLIALLVPCAAPLAAQGTTATISGTVHDPTGAIVPGGQVKATNLDTNVSRSATTNQEGRYSLPFLPVGTYKLEASAPGFKTFEQTGILLEVNRIAVVDPVLQIGALTETVAVTADASLVETTTPALGQLINNEDINVLPLVNRDVYTLLTLTAGVDMTEQATDSFGAPMQVTLVNGSSNAGAGSVNYSLDGGTNASGLRNTGNVVPNPDAVREFKVITNSYAAEYGRFAGGVVDVITKSGTNSYRGSLFEFLRNNKLNASRWLPGQSVLQKDPLHRNQFGGSVGGPIRKGRTFFFFSYSGLRQRTMNFANTATPPTALERTGDLSQTSGTPRDPLTGQPFPDKIIPANRIEPVVKRIMDTYLPLPNLPRNLFEVQDPRPLDTDEAQFKIDHNLGASHQLAGSYFYTRGKDEVGLLGNMPWVRRRFSWTQRNFNFTDTWVISGVKVNQFRMTYIRNFGGRTNLPAVSLGDLGSKFTIQGAPSLPQIQVSGRFNLNSAIPGPVAGSNLYQVRDSLSITSGRHSLKIGGEAQLEKIIHDTLLNNYGVFNFANNNPRGSQNAMADFLLGLPNTMTQDAPTTKIDNGWYFGLFLQDDYRIHERLTLNLGARYDLQLPYKDPFDRKLTWAPGVQSRVVPTAPVGLLFPGDPGVPRGIIPADRNNLSPRVGLAWDPFGDRRSAIRAAFGVFYGSMSGNEANAPADGQPFTTRQQFNNVKSISDPYGNEPGGVSPYPYSYTPAKPRFLAPSGIRGISQDLRLPYTYQMNFSVQRQLRADLSVTAAYVGTIGHKLPLDQDVNYPYYAPGANTQNVNARRPFLPNVLADVKVTKSVLNTAYHGFQLTAEKRLSRNFSAKGYYTFGKSLDTVNLQRSTRQDPQNYNNLRNDRGRTDNDRRHNFVASGIWRLNYFRHRPAVVRALAGGWSISAIVTLRSGGPLTLTSGSDRNYDGLTNDRADLVGNPYLDPNRPRNEVVDQWFNRAAFVPNQIGADGTAGRNILDGPGLRNVDLGVFREFRVGERNKLEFRGESTNALNLVSLSNPGTNVTSTATYGRITTGRAMRQVQLGLRLTF